MEESHSRIIVMPVLNERGNIERIVSEINKAVETDFLFIDDNSTDGTREYVDKLVKIQPKRFHVIKRAKKLGLASAYLEGFEWALRNNYKFIVQMDADFSHQPRFLPEIFHELTHCDLVIGSRYVAGGRVENWSLMRKFISRGGSMYSRMILGVKIKDFTGGFNGWKATSLIRIGLNNIKSQGYCFQIEMKYRAAKSGLNYKEIPIVFPDRTVGESKMSFKIVTEALLKVWSLRFRK